MWVTFPTLHNSSPRISNAETIYKMHFCPNIFQHNTATATKAVHMQDTGAAALVCSTSMELDNAIKINYSSSDFFVPNNPHNSMCTVLLKKLTGFQLVKIFLTFYGTRRFITTLTSARHLSLS